MRKRDSERPEKPTVRQRIADGFDASKEIVLDIPKIVMLGDREAVVENYISIIEYTSEKILLEANPREIKVSGKGLEIRSITREMLFISGRIDGIGFVGER